MLQSIRDKKKENAGFTIIEVLIVLAIAGLILVVVLIAIPQLQRNQRNESRRSIAARVVTEINSYSGNNRGEIPDSAADLADVTDRYLSDINIDDPSSGSAMSLSYVNSTPTDGAVPSATEGTLSYKDGYVCDGERLDSGGDARNFAMWTLLEGGAIACFDNS